MRLRPFICAVLVALGLYGAWVATRRITPLQTGVGSVAQGVFPRDGQFPGEPFRQARRVRAWGSWAGDDKNQGAITIGPFAAPVRLRFGVSGFPAQTGNELFVEHLATKTRLPVRIENMGACWRVADLDLPASWRDQPITLQVIDGSVTLGGWIAVTEPIRGGPGDGAVTLVATLAPAAISGLLLGLLWLAALRGLEKRPWVAAHWRPLVAAGFVAACGYLTFWAYFAHASFGKIVATGFLLMGVAGSFRPKTAGSPAPATAAVATLLLTVGLFYLSLLHLFPSSREFYNLAANRLVEGLPGDNTLPHNLAENLFRGNPLKTPYDDWLTSDRPPLQTGWQLLTWAPTALLGLDPRTASGTASIWFQLLWIPAVYGLLSGFGLPRRRACGWIAVLALTGFFLQHSVFTWPKLSAAAFACGAFALWVLPTPGASRRAEILIGAVLAALAWLSHGGVAFSLLALVPWLLWRAARGEARLWLIAAGVFFLFAAPWLAYQKFYDPPGNRLLKWHLGGQVPKNERGTWETIRDAYGALTPAQILENKRANFALQITGTWRTLADLSAIDAPARRNEEFFYTSRALTWWPLALGLLPWVWARRATRTRLRAFLHVHLALTLWTLAAITVWCLLIFSGGQAVIHQGSFAIMLGLFVLPSVWFELAGRSWLVIIVLLQTVTFVTTWALSNRTIHGPVDGLAAGCTLLAAGALTAIVIRAYRQDPDAAAAR